MAKVQMGVAVNRIAGSINGNTFSKSGFGLILGRKPAGKKTATAKQALTRANFQGNSKLWRSLSNEEIATWQAQRINVDLVDAFGNTYHPSAFNLYMMFARNAQKLNQAPARSVGDLTNPLNIPATPPQLRFQWIGNLLYLLNDLSAFPFENNILNVDCGNIVTNGNNSRVNGLKNWKQFSSTDQITQHQPAVVQIATPIPISQVQDEPFAVDGSTFINNGDTELLIGLRNVGDTADCTFSHIAIEPGETFVLNLKGKTLAIVNPDEEAEGNYKILRAQYQSAQPLLVGTGEFVEHRNVMGGDWFTNDSALPLFIYVSQSDTPLNHPTLVGPVSGRVAPTGSNLLIDLASPLWSIPAGATVCIPKNTGYLAVIATTNSNSQVYRLSTTSTGLENNFASIGNPIVNGIGISSDMTIKNTTGSDLLYWYDYNIVEGTNPEENGTLAAGATLNVTVGKKTISFTPGSYAGDVAFKINTPRQGYTDLSHNWGKMLIETDGQALPGSNFWTRGGSVNRNEAHMTKADAKKALDT